MLRQVTALTHLHHHVQIIRRLERIVQPQYEWVLLLLHNFYFTHRILHISFGFQLLFLHRFHCVVSLTFLNLKYATEGAFAQLFDYFKVTKLYKCSLGYWRLLRKL